MSSFKYVFIEKYGPALYDHLIENFGRYLGSYFKTSDLPRSPFESAQKINEGARFFFFAHGYVVKKKQHREGPVMVQVRYVVKKGIKTLEDFAPDREAFYERFIGDFNFSEPGKILLSDLRKRYEYWFKYRDIPAGFSFSQEELIDKILKTLSERAIVGMVVGNRLYWKP